MISTKNTFRLNCFTLLALLVLGVFSTQIQGQNWQVYNTTNSPIGHDQVSEVSIDPTNRVWFGFEEGPIGPNNSTPISIRDGANWSQLTQSLNGIPMGGVHDQIAMPNGDYWLATTSTLTRKSGSTYTYFQPPNVSVQPAAVDTDAVGNIWVAGYGVSKFDGTNWTEYHTGNSGIVGNNATDVEVDAAGTIWVGTTSGLSKLSGTTWTNYTSSNSPLPTSQVRKVKSDGAGGVWVGTVFGLGHLDNLGTWTIYTTSNTAMTNHSINDIAVDGSGDLWLATNTAVVNYDGLVWTLYNTGNSGITADYAYKLVADAGNLYVVTNDKNLNIYNGTTWTNINYGMGGSFSPSNLSADYAGNILTSGTSYGLYVYDGTSLTQFSVYNTNFQLNQTHTIDFHSNGDALIGSTYGAAEYDGTNWDIYSTSNSDIATDYTEVMVPDGSGGFWVAGNGSGPQHFDGTNWTTYTTSNSGIVSNNITALTVDGNGTVWFGTYSGLTRYNGSTWYTYTSSNSSLSANWITNLYADENNDLWVVSKNFSGPNYVQRRSGFSWINYPNLTAYVNDISFSTSAGLWVGTASGAYKYNFPSWTNYTRTNSQLPSDTVNAIACDTSGAAWFATWNGAARFGPANSVDLGPDVTLCPGDSILLDAGPNFSTYLWSTFQTTQSIYVYGPGTYYVDVVDQNGFTSSDTIVVSSSPSGPISINLGPDTVLCNAGFLVLDAGTIPTGAYLWSDNSTGQFLTVNTTDWYSVFVIDACGNTAYDSIHVTFGNSNPVVILDSLVSNTPPMPRDTFLCADTMWAFVNPPFGCTGCTVTWNVPSGPYGVNITQSGTYSVILDDGNGCLSYDTLTVDMDTSCVWPGDANNDNIANNVDVLSVGLAFNNTGGARPAPYNDNLWYAHPVMDWSTSFLNGMNHKHADCDGNGIVEQVDVNVINQNYGLTHNKFFGVEGGPGDPDLYFYQLQDTAAAGDTITFIVGLGRDTLVADSVYGIAFTFHYDATLIDSGSVVVNYDSSWLGTVGTDMITLDRDFYGLGQTDIGISRTDLMNRDGYGRIASISVVVQDDVAGKDFIFEDLKMSFSTVTMISRLEQNLPVNVDTGQVVIYQFVDGIEDAHSLGAINMYPNPAKDHVIIETQNVNLENIQLTDAWGRIIRTESVSSTRGKYSVNTSSLAPGVYFLRLTDGKVWETKKLMIMR